MFIYSIAKFQFTTINDTFIAFTEKNKETSGAISHHTRANVGELWPQETSSIILDASTFMTL